MKALRFAALALLLMIIAACSFSKNNSQLWIQKRLFGLKSFQCTAQIKAISNKNERIYQVKQIFKYPDKYRIDLLQPQEIKGLTTIFDGVNLCISCPFNSKDFIINSYPLIYGNQTLISEFFSDYLKGEKTSIHTENNTVVFKVQVPTGNYYLNEKILIVDTRNGLPKSMIIFDKEGKTKMEIDYLGFVVNPKIDDSLFSQSKLSRKM